MYSPFQYCNSIGAYVVEIDNAAEQEVIGNLASDAMMIGFDSLGRSEPGDFHWTNSGRKVSDIFECWGASEPNNLGGFERCGNLYALTWPSACGVGRGWNDIGCDSDLSFMCEKDPVPPHQLI